MSKETQHTIVKGSETFIFLVLVLPSAASANLKMWTAVVEGEARNIFPYVHHADFIFNSFIDYELHVLKVASLRVPLLVIYSRFIKMA